MKNFPFPTFPTGASEALLYAVLKNRYFKALGQTGKIQLKEGIHSLKKKLRENEIQWLIG